MVGVRRFLMTCIAFVLVAICGWAHGARAGPMSDHATAVFYSNDNSTGNNACITIPIPAYCADVGLATSILHPSAITDAQSADISVGTCSPGVRDDDYQILGIPENTGGADHGRSTMATTAMTTPTARSVNATARNGSTYATWATVGLPRA